MSLSSSFLTSRSLESSIQFIIDGGFECGEEDLEGIRMPSQGLGGPTLLIHRSIEPMLAFVLKRTEPRELFYGKLYNYLFQNMRNHGLRVPDMSGFGSRQEALSPLVATALKTHATALFQKFKPEMQPKAEDLILFMEKVRGENISGWLIEKYNEFQGNQDRLEGYLKDSGVFRNLGILIFFDFAIGNLDRLVKFMWPPDKPFDQFDEFDFFASNVGNAMVAQEQDGRTVSVYAIDNGIDLNAFQSNSPAENREYNEFLFRALTTPDQLCEKLAKGMNAGFQSIGPEDVPREQRKLLSSLQGYLASGFETWSEDLKAGCRDAIAYLKTVPIDEALESLTSIDEEQCRVMKDRFAIIQETLRATEHKSPEMSGRSSSSAGGYWDS